MNFILKNCKTVNIFIIFFWFTLPNLAFNLMEEGKKKGGEDEGCISLDFPWPLILSSGGYNKEQLPRSLPITNNGAPEPVKIFISGVVQTVSPIIASESEFRVNMKFILMWTDTRLRTENMCNRTDWEDAIALSENVTRMIWLPIPYIVNAKYEEVKKLNRRLISVSLSRSGIVSLSMVVNATVDCGMNFQWYPMDSQICPMHIESFVYDNAFVDYNWLRNKPFKVIPRRLLQYDVVPTLEYTKTLSFKRQLNRNFTRLTIYFRFTRIWSNHLIQTFIPCTLIVSLSWFSFWLELDATSTRGSLLVTSMLTLVTQFWSLRSSLPPVAYVQAVDVWMLGCIITIFMAVAEFALVKTIYSITEKIRQQNSVQSLCHLSFISTGPSTPNSGNHHYDTDLYEHVNKVLYPSYRKKRLGSVLLSGRSTATSHLPTRIEWTIFFGKIRIPLIWTAAATQNNDWDNNHGIEQYAECKKMLLWRQVDVMSKIIFPIVFFLFCAVYWTVLLTFGGVTSSKPME